MDLRALTPGTAVATLDDVADLLDTVAAATDWLAAAADRWRKSRAAVSPAIGDRFLASLRPGADARAQLTDLPAALGQAGAQVWVAQLRGGPARPESGAGPR